MAGKKREAEKRPDDEDLLRGIRIEEGRFGFEPGVTAKIAGQGCRIHGVGIGCSRRTDAEGKKINRMDGVRAIWWLLKNR